MPKLVFINKNFEEQAYEILVEKTTVGRGNHNTLVICDNSVSLTHCEILMNGPEVIVRDLDSSNGTYVEGIRLNKQSQVKSGQVVRFGQVEARLDLDLPTDKESGTSITAVYDLAEYQRQVRREEKKPKQVNIGAKLEPSASVSTAEGHTVLLPRPPQPFPQLSSEEDEDETESRGSRLKMLVWVAMLLGFVVLLWLWWTRQKP